jgi:KUP system potassium uptake protein
MACISVDGCDLRRHWHFAFVCVLLDIRLRANQNGRGWNTFVDHLVSADDGHNEGEGGTFSCYSLLSRYANLANIDPKEAHSLKIQRVLTGDMPRGNRNIRARIEKSALFRAMLKVIGVLAVSLVMADGVLTPAQSVLGAYQGLNVITTVETSTVVGATCGTLVLLFLIQPLGTTKIASTFAPIVVIWLGWIGGIGLFNLIKYDYTVLKAFNPGEAFSFLIRHKEEGWHSLGGVLLCFTGLEAMFAVSAHAQYL